MNTKVYKWCEVPLCDNTSIKFPNKLFICVPQKKAMRCKWLELAQRDPKAVSITSTIYFCEDHFDLPNDMDNFMEYHTMGFVSNVLMKPGCIPTKFKCQSDRRKRISNNTKKTYLLKKEGNMLIEDCENEIEEGDIARKNLELGETSRSSVLHANLENIPVEKENEKVDNILQVHKLTNEMTLPLNFIKTETESKAGHVASNEDFKEVLLIESKPTDNHIKMEDMIEEPSLNKEEAGVLMISNYDVDFIKTETESNNGDASCNEEFEEVLVMENKYSNKNIKIEEIVEESLRRKEEKDILISNYGSIKTKPESKNGVVSCNEEVKHSVHEEVKYLDSFKLTQNTNVPKTFNTNVSEDGKLESAYATNFNDLIVAHSSQDYSETADFLEVVVNEQMENSECETFKCNVCNYLATCPLNLEQHVRTHPGEKQYICNVCNYSTAHSSSLKTHLRTHTGEKPYNCSTCGFSCAQSSTLNTHMRTHKVEKQYKCSVCSYSSAYSSSLKKHFRKHTGEKPYKCCTCDFSCADGSVLRRHTMRIHSGEKPYKCELCDYSSAHSTNLKVHLSTHTGEKPYKCNVCSFSCADTSSLKKHLRTHTGEKPYKCNFCEYSSSRSFTLKLHLRTHTGEKPYKCNICDYSCAQISTLKLHLATHPVEKPYKCNICDYSSARSTRLKAHLRTHTGEKPYVCSVCDYTCSHPYSFKNHMKKHLDPV